MGQSEVFLVLLGLGLTTTFPADPTSFCADWAIRNGVMYKSSPDAYDYRTYYVCQKFDDSYIIKEYLCPFGTVWSDDMLACEEPIRAGLANDPCNGQSSGAKLPYSGECNAYIDCPGSGPGDIVCCPEGELFDAATSVCRLPTGSETCDAACPNVPVSSTPMPLCSDQFEASSTEGKYNQKVHQDETTFIWVERDCPHSYKWDPSTCACSEPKAVADAPSCDHVLLNEFDDAHLSDLSKNKFHVANENVIQTTNTNGNGVARFLPDNPGYIQINGFSNKPWTNTVYIRVIYRESSSVTNDNRYLFHNADCSNGGAASISLMIDTSGPYTVTAEAIVDGTKYAASVDVTSLDEKDVVMIVDSSLLTLNILEMETQNIVTTTTSIPTGGDVNVQRAGLTVGGGKCEENDTNFIGDIELIEIFTGCLPSKRR